MGDSLRLRSLAMRTSDPGHLQLPGMGHDQQAGAKNPWRKMVRLAKRPKAWREEPCAWFFCTLQFELGWWFCSKVFGSFSLGDPWEKYSLQFEGNMFQIGGNQPTNYR